MSEILKMTEESQPENEKKTLPMNILEPEDEFDEEISLEADVEYHSEEATGISKDDYREMLINAQEHGKTSEIFWNMLVDKIHQIGFELPEWRQIEVLDLACGICEEGRVLNSFFGGRKYPEFSSSVNLTAIDIEEESIKNAKYNNRVWDSQKKENYLPSNMCFITGDATRLDQYPEIPSQVDVVIIRHQQLVGSPDQSQYEAIRTWKEIINQGLKKLNSNGMMIITSHDEYQNDFAKRILEQMECEIVLDQDNPYAREKESRYSVMDDHYVLIIRKA